MSIQLFSHCKCLALLGPSEEWLFGAKEAKETTLSKSSFILENNNKDGTIPSKTSQIAHINEKNPATMFLGYFGF